MERHRPPSQGSIDRKPHAHKESNATSITKQNQLQTEIDQLIQHGILDSMVAYDPKLDFLCVPIITRDQVIKQTRRQTCGLIWNNIRSPTISKFIHEDRSCAFVEILRIPNEWSRYDADFLLLRIRQKNFLNGLALRDEFVRILQIILKRDFNEELRTDRKYAYEFKDIDFTRNTIQIVFNSRHDMELSLVVSLILMLEFDTPSIDFFPETFASLCSHDDFNEYLKHQPDVNRTRITPHNSIKFLFDYHLTEVNLCEYLLEKSGSLANMFKSFLKLRKEWLKYVSRAAKYATDTLKTQMHTEKHRQSTCSVNSVRSGASNASNINKLVQNKLPLSTEIEITLEYVFSISLIRLLFLSVCSKYKQFGAEHDNDIAFAIEKAFQLFSDALENNYLEHPFLPNTNIFPDSLLTNDMSIKMAIRKLVKEMQRDWKRAIRR